MNIQTVGQLKALLEQFPEDMPIMAQMQRSWPMREYIGGVWESTPLPECPECGGESANLPEKNADGKWYVQCFEYGCYEVSEVPEPEKKILYVVLNGQPREDTPYGDCRAWEEMITQ